VHVIPAPHETGLPHWPHALHVCVLEPEHCLAVGVHTGFGPHEQAPHAQLVLQLSVPYVLHDCVALGAHAPWPAQLPLVCQAPVDAHVCVSVPHLPHATGLVWPGAQEPVHTPPMHVWFVQADGGPH
jgi:hypothetical protein